MSAGAGLVAGRLALVTGAGSGIGRAACQLLAREGATVIAADKNYDSALETIKAHTVLAATSKDDHSAVEMSVAESKSVQKVLEATLKQYKRPPTIIVNSAGITRDNWILKMSEADYDSVVDVNLKGTFLVMQAFGKAMVDAQVSSGSIINISSIVGKYGNMGQSNYSASKAAVIGLTMSAAKELGRYNIRVNTILPGIINTPIIQTVPDKVKEGFLKMIPLGRIGEPSEVAEVITFLCSDKSSFVTGASIDVTGGF